MIDELKNHPFESWVAFDRSVEIVRDLSNRGRGTPDPDHVERTTSEWFQRVLWWEANFRSKVLLPAIHSESMRRFGFGIHSLRDWDLTEIAYALYPEEAPSLACILCLPYDGKKINAPAPVDPFVAHLSALTAPHGNLPPRGQQVVYIHRKGAVILYVGVTSDYEGRQRQHAKDKPWWDEIEKIQIQLFPTRQEAETTERNLIWDLQPIYNVAHNDPFKSLAHRTTEDGE